MGLGFGEDNPGLGPRDSGPGRRGRRSDSGVAPRCARNDGQACDGRATAHPPLPSPRSRVPSSGLRSQRGYTLIEVIVAFSLMALALTLLLGTLSGATRQVRWAGDAGRATLHAQSLLDQVGIVEPIQAGSTRGNFGDGRYRWTMDIEPWLDPELQQDPLQALGGSRLYEISLGVQWGDGARGQQLQLRTLRLAQGDQQAVLP